jgi:hypothetical protein
MTGCLALLLAAGGHHWIAGLIVLAATVLMGVIRDVNVSIENKGVALVWCLLFLAVLLCLFLVALRPGIGWHGWRLLNAVGIIALGLLLRKLVLVWGRQIITDMPIQIRSR